MFFTQTGETAQVISGFAYVFHLFNITWKLAVVSTMVGAGLRAFDLTAQDILAKIGMTPERIFELLQQGVAWALPNMILGSLVIVPLWCLIYILRPPRG
ncbi:MAG: hypothetical protein AAFR13_02765 [Pseudomonadota bacterium]